MFNEYFFTNVTPEIFESQRLLEKRPSCDSRSSEEIRTKSNHFEFPRMRMGVGGENQKSQKEEGTPAKTHRRQRRKSAEWGNADEELFLKLISQNEIKSFRKIAQFFPVETTQERGLNKRN